MLALAAPASSAPGQVTRFRLSGTVAAADWANTSATSFIGTNVLVSRTKQGSELSVFQFTVSLDANGKATGGTETFADVASGFSFAIDQPGLASASTSGSALPATTCALDADLNQIPGTCSDTAINVTASWTGQGPFSRQGSNSHIKTDGFSQVNHFNGTTRAATASGAVGGVTLSAADLQFAQLSILRNGATTICIGNSC